MKKLYLLAIASLLVIASAQAAGPFLYCTVYWSDSRSTSTHFPPQSYGLENFVPPGTPAGSTYTGMYFRMGDRDQFQLKVELQLSDDGTSSRIVAITLENFVYGIASRTINPFPQDIRDRFVFSHLQTSNFQTRILDHQQTTSADCTIAEYYAAGYGNPPPRNGRPLLR